MAKKASGKKKTGGEGKVRREFSAGFVLFRETPEGIRFLLLDYGKHWDYPKGHLEEGETAWQAAVQCCSGLDAAYNGRNRQWEVRIDGDDPHDFR